jgi:hypothetical protein
MKQSLKTILNFKKLFSQNFPPLMSQNEQKSFFFELEVDLEVEVVLRVDVNLEVEVVF